MLRALDAMSGSPLGAGGLLQIAGTLGSDVPFLTSDVSYALGWGRGERLLALAPPPVRPIALLIPAFSVDTAAAYSWMAAARASAGSGPRALHLDVGSLSHWRSLSSIAHNDFTPVVEQHHPEIRELARTFGDARFALSLMSGSGSTLFGVAEEGVDGTSLMPPSGLAHAGWLVTRTAERASPIQVIA